MKILRCVLGLALAPAASAAAEAGNYVEGYGTLTGRYASDVAEDVIAELFSAQA